MPMLVQWKWQERTKTFLVIFHFYDDYTKANLRLKQKKFREKKVEFERPTITWAPSHPELGLLSELLSYANIVNGLKEKEKRELRRDLEVAVDSRKVGHLFWEPLKTLMIKFSDKILLFEARDLLAFFSPQIVKCEKDYEKDFVLCIELCPEYIDYLRNILKPYISI